MIGMYSSVKFDRKIDLERHYFSPGGYNMTFNGKEFCFDFTNSWRSVDGEDPTVMHFEQGCVDMGYCPEAASLTSEDVRKLEKITEFYIYTGEDGESEIYPVKLLALSFEFEDGESVDCTDMKAVRDYEFDRTEMEKGKKEITKMFSKVRFDRNVDPELHNVSPGEYEMKFNGKSFQFDLERCNRHIDEKDPAVMEFEHWYPEAVELTKEDVRKLEEITEFYIYASGDGCPEIHPVKLLALSFEFNDGEVIDCTDMDAVKNFHFD